ncbi:MAG: alkene reductase [Kofleriaceae bacterium]
MLFDPTPFAGRELANRVVMAPMTRSRAEAGNVPGDLAATYYGQRATAGLIITEGTAPAPDGLGYPRIPGIFSPAQVEGWRKVADTVHAKGGTIFVQLMHTGRVGHVANLPPGAEVLGPTDVAAPGEMYTDASGPQPHTAPRPMTEADITAAVAGYVAAAHNAMAAGLDGIELHAANGYLLEQFLNANVNTRTDGYGGSAANRNRLTLEVAAATVAAIGKTKVGIRISPYGVFNGTGAYPGVDEQYVELATELSRLGLAYLHVVDHAAMGAPEVPAALKQRLRKAFDGTYILSGGYDRARAEADLVAGAGDLVAFGRPFLANPDLVHRLRSEAPLAEADQATFYTPGAKGYTDYPAL